MLHLWGGQIASKKPRRIIAAFANSNTITENTAGKGAGAFGGLAMPLGLQLSQRCHKFNWLYVAQGRAAQGWR
jgi:hypothetical protein